MHLLTTSSHNLHRHVFSSFMIKRSHNLTKRASSESLQKLIPVPYLFMLPPKVPSFKVIFSSSSSYSHIVDSFLIYQFNPLMLWQYLLILLNNFFSWKSRKWFSQSLNFLKLTLLYYTCLLFNFFQFIRSIFLNNTTFRLHFNFTTTSLSSCTNFSRRINNRTFFILFIRWSFNILSHRFRWISSAFTTRRIIKEIWYFWSIPSVRLVMLIKFNLKVYLHHNNNSTNKPSILQTYKHTFKTRQINSSLYWLDN